MAIDLCLDYWKIGGVRGIDTDHAGSIDDNARIGEQ